MGTIWRILKRLVLFTAVGAVITIAVAWSRSLTADFQIRWTASGWFNDARLADGYSWRYGEISVFGGTTTFISAQPLEPGAQPGDPTLLMPPWTGMLAAIESRPSPHGGGLREDAYGWPFLAMTAQWDYRDGNFAPPVHGIPMSTRGAGSALPTRPIPLAFAADWAIYGVSAYLVTTGLRRVSSVLRPKSNRCPACGYSTLGSASSKCPECGNSTAPEHAA